MKENQIRLILEDESIVDPNVSILDEVIGVVIDDREFYYEKGCLAITEDYLEGFKAIYLPENIKITPCTNFTSVQIDQDNFWGDIVRRGNKIIYEFGFSNNNDSDEEIQKINLIEEFINLKNDMIQNVYTDEELITFEYIIDNIEKRNIEDIICEILKKIIYPIFPENQNLLEINDFNSEEEFTLNLVIPSLKKIFKEVEYNHGKEEFGKDILYKKEDEFGNTIHGGAQVKLGNMSGSATSDLNEIVNQIEDAFDVPVDKKLNSSYNRFHIKELLIICSGKYTNHAKKKIIEKINKSYPVKFLDGESIKDILRN
ncbi:hypothetical protein [Halanaerobium praevalens]|uniref:Restriction endonuclease type IV Mrr domain-containing protein n=1 Tax=Halanaerobium praevalens (strain ATCC 33744 / DSM 2228 / GSL) TaxID=572479 RepID=E3DLI1_HALPG|nr:hypothetical protein [Halanaerobium praevalens]ADO77220.1 hypothetical protein Hprae_1068 [Halanaerobium praevalens DSM 2228]